MKSKPAFKVICMGLTMCSGELTNGQRQFSITVNSETRDVFPTESTRGPVEE